VNPLMIPLAILGPFTFGAFVISFWALHRSKSAQAVSTERVKTAQELQDLRVEELQRRVETLAAKVQELSEQQPSPYTPQIRNGLNLSKRSQVLRMYRGGDTAGQIAASLDLPLQEVELLLKVHQIIMSRI